MSINKDESIRERIRKLRKMLPVASVCSDCKKPIYDGITGLQVCYAIRLIINYVNFIQCLPIRGHYILMNLINGDICVPLSLRFSKRTDQKLKNSIFYNS